MNISWCTYMSCIIDIQPYILFFRSTSMQGKLLKHNLDTEVVDALKDLKMKLSQNGPK